MTFKVQKSHEKGNAPPERHIVSQRGSLTDNIIRFVEHHIKDLRIEHDTYLQDSPDFLRKFEVLDKHQLSENTSLASMDDTGLFTNTPQEEGLECVAKALAERKDPKVSSGFVFRLLKLYSNTISSSMIQNCICG